MRRVFYVCALVAASTYAVNIDAMEPAELEFEDDMEFPEVDADGKQFMAKLGSGLATMGRAVGNKVAAGARYLDKKADDALVGTQRGLRAAAGAASRGLANAAGAVGKYA